MTLILDGAALQTIKRDALTREISGLKATPRLAIIQVGDDPRSDVYVGRKIKFAEQIGVAISHIKLPADIGRISLEQTIREANTDNDTHGIIVQLPLPKALQAETKDILNVIDPKKDVDGLTADSKAALMAGHPFFIPATTKGTIALLDHYQIPIEGAHVLILGRSELVGKPTALAFLNRNATVTIAHSQSSNVAALASRADIIVSATGKPGIITAEHVSEKSVVIDVGITVIDETRKKIVGDVDFEALKEKVRAISPVPGGVGPLTIACLFENVLEAFRRQTRA